MFLVKIKMKKIRQAESSFSGWKGEIEIEGTKEELAEQERYQKKMEEKK